MFHSQCQLCFHYHHQNCYLITYPQRSPLRRFLHFHTKSGFSNENQSKIGYFSLLILFLILRYRGEIQSTPYSCLIKNYSRTKGSGKSRKRTRAGGEGDYWEGRITTYVIGKSAFAMPNRGDLAALSLYRSAW